MSATSTKTSKVTEAMGSAAMASSDCRAANQLCATTAESDTITACQNPHQSAVRTTMSR